MEENDKPVDFGNYLTIGVSKEFKCSDGGGNHTAAITATLQIKASGSGTD